MSEDARFPPGKTDGDLRPVWYLGAARLVVPAGKRPPADATHWTEEGMTEWLPIEQKSREAPAKRRRYATTIFEEGRTV